MLPGCTGIHRKGALGEMIDSVTFPDPKRPLDDESLKALCRKFSGSGFHPSGTVKMGPATDPMAVVDQYGCCHFQDSLVVADASILPAVPSANTNLSAILTGRTGRRVAAHGTRPLRALKTDSQEQTHDRSDHS